MAKTLRTTSAVFFILLLGALPLAHAENLDCRDTDAALDYWRPIQAQAPNSQQPPDSLALELVSCLSSPVPELRDQIGYELFTFWLRDDRLKDETRTTLLSELSALMIVPPATAPDDTALGRSFSALILAEIMRSDASKPFMSFQQRQALLDQAMSALVRENDFRGLDAEVGWVHPVAHLSDLLWRFALHPETTSEQLELILTTVRTKVAPTTTFYHFNESDRLARVVTTIIRRGLVEPEDIVEWTAPFQSPQSMERWSNAFSSREGMAELHNTKLFLRALSDQLAGTETSPQILEALEALVDAFTQLV